MPGPLGLIVKGIGSGIGLASEAIADRKERKAAAANPQDPSASSGAPRSRSTSPYPPEKTKSHEGSDSSSDDDIDNDQAEWALDDAAMELEPPAYSEKSLDDLPPMPVDELVHSFIANHHTGVSGTIKPIPMPVILPQRRPKDKTRGFIRAYPPILGECSDIDEQTFLDFLDDFYKSSKSSPVFNVINLACMVVGFVPNPITMGVSIAVQVANRTAQEVQTRYRTNTYLDQINESLFKPRGLYAMIMAFKPDQPGDPVVNVNVNNISSTDMALTKSLSVPESDMSKKLKQIRLTSGATKGEISLPTAAPLVYPGLDAAAKAAVDGNGQLSKEKQGSLKSSGAFIASYLDRRAQATYVGTNPDSKLAAAMPPPEKKFASRFSDPNHPANSGTILGLLTGGNFDPKAKKRGRRAQQRAAWSGQQLTEADIKNAEMGRGPRKSKGPISSVLRRVLQKNVLYLIITNLPSESEMMEMRQELERMKEPEKA